MSHNDESGFYHLIPKGVGFEHPTSKVSSEPPDEEVNEILGGFDDILERARRDLCDMCGYKLRPYIETQEILYVKALFIVRICTHLKCECSATQYRAIVNIFLADTGVLFTDADSQFYHGRVNKENISAWTPYFNDAKKRRILCDALPIYTSKGFRKEDIPLYNGMLDAISTMAAAKHQNMQDWVRRNLPYDESDTAKNLTLLRKMFAAHAQEITHEISEKFFTLVLPEYMSKVALVSDKRFRPDSLPASVDREQAQLFVYYQERLCRLEYLHTQYLKETEVSTSILNLKKFKYIAINANGCAEHEPEIRTAIQSFFAQCRISLHDDDKGILQQRIVWAMHQKTIPDALKPIFLVYMTICCNRNITIGIECPVREPPIFDSRYSKRKQRYFQLVLLRQLCDVLSIDKEGRMDNWKQYLAWQGTNILSIEEVQFWKQQLGQEYDRLPVIGFQLCCTDYIADCIPLHLERLSYDRTSTLHRGGYHEFWIQNQQHIRSESEDLRKQHPQILKQYQKFWNKPKEYYFECKTWFGTVLEHDIYIDLSKFDEVPACNEDELRRLVLETELQLCINKDAQLKLQQMCVDVYGLSRDLFASFQ